VETFGQLATIIERTAHAFESFSALSPEVLHEDEQGVIIELSGLASPQVE